MTGKVFLVGAGPGDPGLITLRAVELIKKADVVLYDRLVSKKILSMIPKKAKAVYVGRAVGDDYKHQDSTNDLMVKYAKTKRCIVRLKGGDPIMFGRGGEEAEYLKKHKIRFEIIPGITSGIGSATYAGIPLTHRKFASSVVFVTGHEDFEKSKEAVRWKTCKIHRHDSYHDGSFSHWHNLQTIVKWRNGQKNSCRCDSGWYHNKAKNDYRYSFKYCTKSKAV